MDDKLLQRSTRSITRGDVAEIAVQSLSVPSARNRSVDIINDVDGSKPLVTEDDFEALFSGMSANCDYSINEPVLA